MIWIFIYGIATGCVMCLGAYVLANIGCGAIWKDIINLFKFKHQ